MSWWRPWTWWWRRPANGSASTRAQEDAQRKLAEARRDDRTRAAVSSFEAAVEAALRGRRR